MSYDSKDFQKDVIEKSYEMPVLVDFWAEWCAPCKVLAPILEKVAEKNQDRFAFAKLNTEHYSRIATQYGIRGIPNVKLFVDGEVVNEFQGALPEAMIENWLDKNLPSPLRKKIAEAFRLVAEARIDEAQGLLKKILKAEPQNAEAAVLLGNIYLYSDATEAMAAVSFIEADSEFYQQAESIRNFGRLFQFADSPEQLSEDDVKAGYLQAIHSLKTKDFDTALNHFIEVLQSNRKYDDDGARKACIAIFKYLGEDNELTRKHRPAFSSALYS